MGKQAPMIKGTRFRRRGCEIIMIR
jgi:hypothetical protein